MKEIDDIGESKKLNAAVNGRVVDRITYHETGDSHIAIWFADGGRIVLSTLGGVEIEEL